MTSLGKTTYRNVGPEPENTRVKKCLNVSEEQQQPECHRSHPSFLRHKPGAGLVLVLTPGICHWFTDRKVKVEVQYCQNITYVGHHCIFKSHHPYTYDFFRFLLILELNVLQKTLVSGSVEK